MNAAIMSTYELFSAVLGTHAAMALGCVPSMPEVRRMRVSELISKYGISQESARRLSAVVALSYRIGASPLQPQDAIRESAQIVAHARAIGMADLTVEQFRVLLLDAKNHLLDDVLCSQGILTASLVHPREVFAPAIRARAAMIVLLHNHPSGDPEPSPEDISVTERLVAVGKLVGIRIADHVIVGRHGHASFLERGLIGPMQD